MDITIANQVGAVLGTAQKTTCKKQQRKPFQLVSNTFLIHVFTAF